MTSIAADLFMHPQSCMIEEIVDEQDTSTSSSEQESGQSLDPSSEAAGGTAASADPSSSKTASQTAAAAAQAADAAISSSAATEEAAEAAAPGASAATDVHAADAAASSSSSGSEEQLDPQLQQLIAECERLKQEGNALYAQGEYDGALQLYWQAIDQAPEDAQERAVYLCNAAACYLKKQDWQLACEQCSAALKINGSYLKALVRRATALQELDDLEHALADAQKVVELDPGNAWAVKTVAKLTPEVQARQEKLKEEMLGKLKDLGNSLLGKFGLSLDNFKAEQDPATGGYSIKFNQS